MSSNTGCQGQQYSYVNTGLPFTKTLERKSLESTGTTDVYKAFPQTSMLKKASTHGHPGNNQPQNRVQKPDRETLSTIGLNTGKDIISECIRSRGTTAMSSNTGCRGQYSYVNTGLPFTKTLERKSIESTGTTDVYNAFPQTGCRGQCFDAITGNQAGRYHVSMIYAPRHKIMTGLPFTKTLARKSIESLGTTDVYNAFPQTGCRGPCSGLITGIHFAIHAEIMRKNMEQKQHTEKVSFIDPYTRKDISSDLIPSRSASYMASNTRLPIEHVEFSHEESNFSKIGIIVLNILGDVMYDRLTLDGQQLRARKEYDITMLYNEHRNLNINRPSNSSNRNYGPWGGTWQDIQNTDTAIGDDIERIRLIRNELYHSTSYELDDTRFIELCSIIHAMVGRFDQHNKPKVMYSKKLKEVLWKAKHV